MSMKTKDDSIQGAGLAETTWILRPQRTVPQNDRSATLSGSNRSKLDTAIKSVVAVAGLKTRGTNRECL